MMHLGHGHRPMLRIVASNTLEGVKTIPGEQRQDSLFGIIGRIGEYSRIKPVINAITTANNDTVLPCLYKLIVKKNPPLCMEQLAMAVSHEVGRWGFTAKMVSCEIFEAVRELESVRE